MDAQDAMLALTTELRQREHDWKLDRQRSTMHAERLMALGLPVSAVARMWECHPATVYRRIGELHALVGDDAGELAALAAGDQAAAADAEAQDMR